ncbi:MAG: bestrophin family ion channel [Myxococcota bacterium]
MIDYDPHNWRRALIGIHGTRFSVIAWRALAVTLVAAVITLVHVYVTPMSVPQATTIHGILSVALGLLLVFRTNQSYDRWWEGRKLWGAMVNTCRNFARMATVHLDKHPEQLRRVLALDAAFPEVSMFSLRGRTWEPTGLEADDADFIRGKKHRATAVAQRISFHLRAVRDAGGISDFVLVQLEHDVHQLIDIIGGCERIHKTPLPFAYVVHLRRSLVAYCATLPFAMLANFGWSTIPIVFAVTYVLLGIEEIGVEIEDPFEGDLNDLPLEDITATIQANVAEYRS